MQLFYTTSARYGHICSKMVAIQPNPIIWANDLIEVQLVVSWTLVLSSGLGKRRHDVQMTT